MPSFVNGYSPSISNAIVVNGHQRRGEAANYDSAHETPLQKGGLRNTNLTIRLSRQHLIRLKNIDMSWLSHMIKYNFSVVHDKVQ